jgi:hypothetical protein
MGQQDNEQAMPLNEFLTETLTLLDAQPDATLLNADDATSARLNGVPDLRAAAP